jgi:Cysteine-rich secretory protein family
MRIVAVVVVGLMLLGSVVALRHDEANAAGSCDASTTETSVEQQLVGLINGYRAANNLPPLGVSSVLTRSAHWMANDLVSHGYFAHEPDSLGRSFVTRSHDCGVSGYFGENLAAGDSTPAQTLAQWEGSAPHNAALLSSRFTSIGVAVDGAMWVADFGSAQNDSAPPPNQTPTKSPTAVPTPTMTPTPPSSPLCPTCWWRGHVPEIGSG